MIVSSQIGRTRHLTKSRREFGRVNWAQPLPSPFRLPGPQDTCVWSALSHIRATSVQQAYGCPNLQREHREAHLIPRRSITKSAGYDPKVVSPTGSSSAQGNVLVSTCLTVQLSLSSDLEQGTSQDVNHKFELNWPIFGSA